MVSKTAGREVASTESTGLVLDLVLGLIDTYCKVGIPVTRCEKCCKLSARIGYGHDT